MAAVVDQDVVSCIERDDAVQFETLMQGRIIDHERRCVIMAVDLLEMKMGVDPAEVTYLMWAAHKGRVNIVSTMLRMGFWAPFHEHASDQEVFWMRQPLILAASAGHLSVVRALLEWGVPVIYDSHMSITNPVWWACRSGHVDVVRVLLEADPTSYNLTDPDDWLMGYYDILIMDAVGYGQMEIVRLLLMTGVVFARRWDWDVKPDMPVYNVAQAEADIVRIFRELILAGNEHVKAGVLTWCICNAPYLRDNARHAIRVLTLAGATVTGQGVYTWVGAQGGFTRVGAEAICYAIGVRMKVRAIQRAWRRRLARLRLARLRLAQLIYARYFGNPHLPSGRKHLRRLLGQE
jgi:hypothetical protein